MRDSEAHAWGPDAQLFYAAFKASPIGMAVESMEGRPLFANPALCAMFGLSEEEICGKHCVDFSPREDAEKDWELFERLRAGLLKHYSLEKRFFRRDGSLFRGRVNIAPLNSFPSPLVVAMVEEIKEHITTEEIPHQSQANLQKALGDLIQAQENERTAVARELRNGVNDPVMLLSATLDRLQQNLPESPAELKAKIQETRERLLDIVERVNTITHPLYSWNLEFLGFVQAAAGICKELRERQGIEIHFLSGTVPQEPPREISCCLFRVLQEALPVLIKNMAAGELRVSIDVQADEIHLMVGASPALSGPELAMTEDDVSMTTMEGRLKLVHGELSVESDSQKGTSIHARVPLSLGTKSQNQNG